MDSCPDLFTRISRAGDRNGGPFRNRFRGFRGCKIRFGTLDVQVRKKNRVPAILKNWSYILIPYWAFLDLLDIFFGFRNRAIFRRVNGCLSAGGLRPVSDMWRSIPHPLDLVPFRTRYRIDLNRSQMGLKPSEIAILKIQNGDFGNRKSSRK